VANEKKQEAVKAMFLRLQWYYTTPW
jgi:hypothetical protein